MMSYAYVVVALLLAALLIFAATRKLSHRPDVVASYARVGVPAQRLNVLAMLLIAAAAGLVAGIVVAPAGVAAAACLVAYFAVATAAHVRHRDLANIAMPIVLLVMAAVALALRIGLG